MATFAERSPVSLRAADLMTPEVILLPAEMSLQAAARLLYRMQIGGAPVVDDTGHCIGVLSTTDFMHCIEKDARPGAMQTCGRVHSPWEIPEDAEINETCRVQDYMSRNPVTVPLAATLPDLARTMLEAHIHRLVVVDKDGKPQGIVSTTDILAALARAAGIGLHGPGAAAHGSAARTT